MSPTMHSCNISLRCINAMIWFRHEIPGGMQQSICHLFLQGKNMVSAPCAGAFISRAHLYIVVLLTSLYFSVHVIFKHIVLIRKNMVLLLLTFDRVERHICWPTFCLSLLTSLGTRVSALAIMGTILTFSCKRRINLISTCRNLQASKTRQWLLMKQVICRPSQYCSPYEKMTKYQRRQKCI